MSCLSDSSLSLESFEGAVFDFQGLSLVRELLQFSRKPRVFEVSDPSLRGSVRCSVSMNAVHAWLVGGGPTRIRAVWHVRGSVPLSLSLRCLTLGGINEISLVRTSDASEILLEEDCQGGGCDRTLELTEGEYVLRAWTLDGRLAMHANAEPSATARVL